MSLTYEINVNTNEHNKNDVYILLFINVNNCRFSACICAPCIEKLLHFSNEEGVKIAIGHHSKKYLYIRIPSNKLFISLVDKDGIDLVSMEADVPNNFNNMIEEIKDEINKLLDDGYSFY